MLTGYKIIHVPAQAAYSYKRRFTVKGKPEKAPKAPKAPKTKKPKKSKYANVTSRKPRKKKTYPPESMPGVPLGYTL